MNWKPTKTLECPECHKQTLQAAHGGGVYELMGMRCFACGYVFNPDKIICAWDEEAVIDAYREYNRNYAYLAGLVDAGGSILYSKKGANRTRSPRISVSNNSKEIIDWLVKHFSGHVTSKKPKKPTHSINYEWRAKDSHIQNILKHLTPFLIHPKKKYRAQILLDNYFDLKMTNQHDLETKRKREQLAEDFFKVE